MTRRIALAFIVAAISISPVVAQNVQEQDAAALRPMAEAFRKAWKLQPSKPVGMSLPLFDRVMQFSLPVGYVPAYQAQNQSAFIMEFIPDGEKIESWTKLVTITSSAGVGSFALDDVTLAKTVIGTSAGCAGYSHFQILGSRRIDDELGEVSVSKGCGGLTDHAYRTAPQGNGEQVVMLFFRDKLNTYSVQYAERGEAFAAATLPISGDRAKTILKAFGEVLLCAPNAVDKPCKDVLIREALRKGGGT